MSADVDIGTDVNVGMNNGIVTDIDVRTDDDIMSDQAARFNVSAFANHHMMSNLYTGEVGGLRRKGRRRGRLKVLQKAIKVMKRLLRNEKCFSGGRLHGLIDNYNRRLTLQGPLVILRVVSKGDIARLDSVDFVDTRSCDVGIADKLAS
jgi:hypothetical protein